MHVGLQQRACVCVNIADCIESTVFPLEKQVVTANSASAICDHLYRTIVENDRHILNRTHNIYPT